MKILVRSCPFVMDEHLRTYLRWLYKSRPFMVDKDTMLCEVQQHTDTSRIKHCVKWMVIHVRKLANAWNSTYHADTRCSNFKTIQHDIMAYMHSINKWTSVVDMIHENEGEHHIKLVFTDAVRYPMPSTRGGNYYTPEHVRWGRSLSEKAFKKALMQHPNSSPCIPYWG